MSVQDINQPLRISTGLNPAGHRNYPFRSGMVTEQRVFSEGGDRRAAATSASSLDRHQNQGRNKMELNKEMLTMLQERMGYTDREMEIFMSDPRNIEVLKKVPEIMNKMIVAEVVESHGCYGMHRVGEKFYMDNAGGLISDLCPKWMCIHLVSAFKPLVFAVVELLLAGVDPNEMRFKRTGCLDVGLECGGWGKVAVEIRVEER